MLQETRAGIYPAAGSDHGAERGSSSTGTRFTPCCTVTLQTWIPAAVSSTALHFCTAVTVGSQESSTEAGGVCPMEVA